jgi:CDP-paratose 2-epimerase
MCAVKGIDYTIFGHKGKQVRDQIHSSDVISIFLEFYRAPRPGEVYNLGGGRRNSVSILETIQSLREMGFNLNYQLRQEGRIGDHICYISDLAKVRSHYPGWQPKHDLSAILSSIVNQYYESSRCYA